MTGTTATSKVSSTPTEGSAGRRRSLAGAWLCGAQALALAFALFHVYTAVFGTMEGMRQRVVHVAFALALTFLVSPATRIGKQHPPTVVDLLWVIGVTTASAYLAYENDALDLRRGIAYPRDVLVGLIVVAALLEATRRLTGWALPLVASSTIAYAYFGPYMPDFIAHKGLTIKDIMVSLVLTTEGVYGIPIGVCSTFIILFVIVGAMLKETGAVHFFTDLAMGLFGRVRGGPAKVAIIASGLFGMISGSAVANVSGTGIMTIPLMIRTGFSPRFAAAVEAVASSCGQFMPPIMAAAAFVIAEYLGISYLEVAVGALIPALLFYGALFVAVDLRAARLGLHGSDKSDLPRVSKVLLDGGYLILVPGTLIFLLAVVKYSPLKAAVYTLGVNLLLFLIHRIAQQTRRDRVVLVPVLVLVHAAVFALGEWVGAWPAIAGYAAGLASVWWLSRDPRRTSALFLWQFVRSVGRGLQAGAMGTLEVAAACACAGIIIGMLMLTGLGLRLSGMLIDLSGGSIPLLLVLTMISSLILGMGVPTLGAYIILAVLVAPALVGMGIEPLAAHLFIFYFGVISCITPPVAMAAFAAAAISGSSAMGTGVTALRLGLAVFIVPYMMVYNPELIMLGEWYRILLVSATAMIGVFALAGGLEGFWLCRMTWWERAAFVGAGLALIEGGLLTDLAGVALIAAVLFVQVWRRRSVSSGVTTGLL